MTKAKDDGRRPAAGQAELLAKGDVDRPVRRVEQGVLKAVEAAHLDDRDAGMAALAVECGAAVDVAQRRLDPFAVAAAARELRETLIRLKLDPVSRDGGGDDLDELLRQLGDPSADVPADDQP